MNRTQTRPPFLLRLTLVALVLTLITCVVAAAVAQALSPRPQVAGQVEPAGEIGEADGMVPDGEPLDPDGSEAAIAGLNRELLAALREAAKAAESDGIDLRVTSGWRTERYQQKLLDDAVADYGSVEEAARWVATPTTSAHVRGEAVDVGFTDAYYWLMQYGARWGLCNVYNNEPWHFELTGTDESGACPVPYADPTEDPRLQG